MRTCPTRNSPIVQVKLVASNVPTSGLADTKVNPSGKLSVTVTPVASEPPWFSTVINQVTFSPTLTTSSLTDLINSKSAAIPPIITSS